MYNASEQRSQQSQFAKQQQRQASQMPPMPPELAQPTPSSTPLPGSNASPLITPMGQYKESSATGGLMVDPQQQQKLGGMSVGT
jgi:hypothetical protein